MTVRSMVTPGVECISADASIRRAALKMREARVGMLVVVRHWEAVGVVTDRDLVTRALANELDTELTPVGQVMSSPAVCVREEDTLEHVVATMRRTHHRRLLVVSAQGRPCGVLSMDDVLRRLTEAFHGLGELVSAPAEALRPEEHPR